MNILKRASRSRLLTGVALLFGVAPSVSAALLATDNASDAAYADGWQTGDNGGTSWGGIWILNGSATSGHFVFDSTKNGDGADNGIVGGIAGDGDINTAGPAAWGMYANSGANSFALRTFTGNLDVGQGFTIDFDNGFIDGGGTIGLNLLNSLGHSRLTLQFNGGSPTYTVFDTTLHDTLVPYTDEGLRMEMILTGTDTYSMKVTRRDGVTNTLTGTLGAGAGTGIDRVQLVNLNAGFNASNDAYFNSMAVTPEPASLALCLAGAIALRRHRRPAN